MSPELPCGYRKVEARMRNGFRSIALRSFAIFGGLLTTAACDIRSSESYRYRVTVEVQTPQGVRSGSSVWETKSWEGSGIPDTAIRSKVSGEAVAVDLPGGTVFALLRGADMNVDYASGVVAGHVRKYPPPGFSATKDWKEIDRAIAKQKPAFELYPDEYPLLVRFRDINDPASVEKVDPSNLAASFGPGVSLKRITIAVTNDGVTTGIRERLHWLGKYPEPSLKPNHSADDWSVPAKLTHGDFAKD